jgi:hypothetical protein
MSTAVKLQILAEVSYFYDSFSHSREEGVLSGLLWVFLMVHVVGL